MPQAVATLPAMLAMGRAASAAREEDHEALSADDSDESSDTSPAALFSVARPLASSLITTLSSGLCLISGPSSVLNVSARFSQRGGEG